jgi:hypothetical protein
MPLKFKPKKIIDKNVMANRNMGKLSVVSGKKAYRATDKDGRDNYKVLELSKRLKNNHTLKDPQNTNNNALAKEILSVIGVSCITNSVTNKTNYSLIDHQLDTELILNPNKVDFADLKHLDKGKITFEKLIRNTDDPFYTLDEDISKNYINQNEKIIKSEEDSFNFVAVVSMISNMNLYNPKSPSTRALKSTKIDSQGGY